MMLSMAANHWDSSTCHKQLSTSVMESSLVVINCWHNRDDDGRVLNNGNDMPTCISIKLAQVLPSLVTRSKVVFNIMEVSVLPRLMNTKWRHCTFNALIRMLLAVPSVLSTTSPRSSSYCTRWYWKDGVAHSLLLTLPEYFHWWCNPILSEFGSRSCQCARF